MKAVHAFIAAVITDETLKERVLHVFSALPEDVQKEFMHDPGFSIATYNTGRSGGARVTSGMFPPAAGRTFPRGRRAP